MEIGKLEKIGLSKRESEIYLALLQKKEFTAAEIASITDVTRTKVYEILQNLEIKGLCTGIQRNNRKKYRAIDPKIAFQNVISEDEIKLNKKREIANQLGEDLHYLFEKNTSENNPLDYIEILNDKNQIHKRWMSIQSLAKHEVLFFTKGPYTATFSKDMNGEINVLKKGIKCKCIYEYKDIMNKDSVTVISSWVRAGEEARVVEELPIKLAIFDERITMLALNDPISLKPSITTMVISHPGFAKSQKYVFESMWEKAMTIEEFKIKEKI